MNVGGAALKGGENRGVDKANNGADVFGVSGELLDGDVFVGVFVAGEHVEGQAFAGLIEDALRLLGFLQQVGDLRERGHTRQDARPQKPGNLIEHHQPRGVAYGDHQSVFLLFDGHEVVAEHQLYPHGGHQFVLNLEVFEVDELGVIARGESLSLGALVGSRAAGDGKRNNVGFGHTGTLLHPVRLPQRKDGQVERDENEDHDDAHYDENGRLDQGQRRRQRGGHVLLKELRYRVQHLRQGAGLLAYRIHLRCQFLLIRYW